MKKIFLTLLMLFVPLIGYATNYEITTPGNNVGIGSTNPGQALDVNGTIRATDILGTGNTTFVVCSPTANVHWHCDYTANTTDAETAINLAITAANALTYGGKVLLTEGKFHIGANNTPVIPLSNVWVDGSGMYGITVLEGDVALANASSGVVVNTSAQINNFRISNLKIDGTPMRSGTWNVQNKGISITDGTTANDNNLMVDHVWVYNTPATCIALDGGTQEIATHNLMDSCGTTGKGGTGGTGYPLGNNGFGYGFAGSGIYRGVTVSNNVCKNVVDVCILFEEQSGTTGASWGFTITSNVDTGSFNTVRLSAVSGATISNNISYNTLDSSYAIITDSAVATIYKDIVVSNNYSFNAANQGIAVLAVPSSGVPTNILITGNTIDTCTTFGIQDYTGYTSITNNVIYNCGEDGIYWLSGQSETGLKIVNNLIYHNGTASTAQHESGINIKINNTYTLTNLDIEGNLITTNTGYGVDTELGSGTFANFILRNNDLSGNTLGATLLTGSTFTIGNQFFPFGNHGFTTNNYVEGNLNVQSNVGIGSTTPGQALDVQGTLAYIHMQDTGGSNWHCKPAVSTGVFTCTAG